MNRENPAYPINLTTDGSDDDTGDYTSGPPVDRLVAIQASRLRLRKLLHRWIVLYNPFYFAATLSLLSGVLLISDSLEGSAVDWTTGYLWIVGVLQSYEFCLIALAAWLMRRGLRRPAVILALLECLLLVDPTLANQVVAHMEPYDAGLAMLFAGLVVVKMLWLAKAVGLRLSRRAMAEIGLPLTAMALVPTALDNRWASGEAVLLTVIWAATAWLLVWRSNAVRFELQKPLGPWADTVLQRFVTVLRVGLPVAFLLHAASWCLVFDIELLPIHLLPVAVALVWIFRSSTYVSWPMAVIAISLSEPSDGTLMLTALTLGLIFARQVFETPGALAPLMASMLSVYLAACAVPLNPPAPQTSLPADVFLLLFGCWAAWHGWHLLPLAPGLTALGIRAVQADHDPLQTGIGLVAAGFVTLAVGTWLATRLTDPPGEAGHPDG